MLDCAAMPRTMTHATAWAILALVATMIGVASIAGDLCSDGGAAGCAQACHLACTDGCANATLIAQHSLPAPTPLDEVCWWTPLDVGTSIGPPDSQPPRTFTL